MCQVNWLLLGHENVKLIHFTYTQKVIGNGRIPVVDGPVEEDLVEADSLDSVELDFRLVEDDALHDGDSGAVVILAVAQVSAVVRVT